jgi:hypothetical protein
MIYGGPQLTNCRVILIRTFKGRQAILFLHPRSQRTEQSFQVDIEGLAMISAEFSSFVILPKDCFHKLTAVERKLQPVKFLLHFAYTPSPHLSSKRPEEQV